MAKVTLATDIVAISGKLCAKEGVIYNVNKRTGKVYRSDRHSFTDNNTAKQQTVRTLFKQKSKAASIWWGQNKEKKGTDGTVTQQASEAMKTLMKKYVAQTKVGNPYSFFRSLISDDLKVELGGTTYQLSLSTDGTPPTQGGVNIEE